MNETVMKKALILSLILGAFIGIASLIPAVIGFGLFVLMFLVAPLVIIYMKKNKEYFSYINNEQGAIFGAIMGFGATIGFFASFAPLVCLIRFIFKTYYSYMIPDMISSALWLFFVLVFMIALVFAATNATSAMGLTWFYSHFETKAQNEERLDIKIED